LGYDERGARVSGKACDRAGGGSVTDAGYDYMVGAKEVSGAQSVADAFMDC
jgi:hypothetical protein